MLRALMALIGLLLAAGPLPAAAQLRWVNVVQQTPEGGYRQGNPNAPVKLVEYGSRSCPTCRAFALEGMAPLRAKYIATGKLSYEFREFPVQPHDVANILLGRCVPAARYFAVLDAMFAEQDRFETNLGNTTLGEVRRIGALPPEQAAAAWARAAGYLPFMQRFGLAPAQAQTCLTDTAAMEALGNRIAAAREAGVSHTPTFFINGQPAGGHPHSWADLEPQIIAAGG